MLHLLSAEIFKMFIKYLKIVVNGGFIIGICLIIFSVRPYLVFNGNHYIALIAHELH